MGRNPPAENTVKGPRGVNAGAVFCFVPKAKCHTSCADGLYHVET